MFASVGYSASHVWFGACIDALRSHFSNAAMVVDQAASDVGHRELAQWNRCLAVGGIADDFRLFNDCRVARHQATRVHRDAIVETNGVDVGRRFSHGRRRPGAIASWNDLFLATRSIDWSWTNPDGIHFARH